MRIVTVGGGPAGLYASLLIKKADPTHDISVVERNPAGATYGWGVVFSDRTLGEFREADARTSTQITDEFVSWDAIDVRYRGSLIRSGGHVFAGIARKRLLAILARRCHELGVEVRYETEIRDPAELFDVDAVIAADGVNSLVREHHAHVFRPRMEEGSSRYIWYGTPLPLDSFTFAFQETEHGLFQAHAYPFDGTMSTFIVECAEETWRAAGLDDATGEESIAFCEKLFADDLRGARLLSNSSKWISFATLKNRTWHHANVALIGDAAHTAHFSIGSGTKLAMEDAIALARAFETHPHDLDSAFADYEAERKPVVERFQEAAAESRTYFESTDRWTHLAPEQFAFHLLTRSGRIDYDVLRIRDPAYADGVDRWFASVEGAVAPPPLFTPYRLGRVELPNRAVRRGDAHGPGGAGLVLTDIVAVAPEGRITPEDPTIHDADRWEPIVQEAHETGTRIGIRLGHAGRRGACRPRSQGVDRPIREGAWPLIAPTPAPYGPLSDAPEPMDRGDMDRVREAFVQGARRAGEAGFDLVEIHMGHGYLLGSFLSPLTNPAEDGARYPLEVFNAVRAAWDGPLAVALNATDWHPKGVRPEQVVAFAGKLHERGCDLVEVLAGQTVPRTRPRYGPAFLAPYADLVRNEARVPVLCGGGVFTTGRANTMLAAGRADLVILDRVD